MIGVFSRGGGLAQASLVFGNNIVYSINAGKYKNDWQARGFGVLKITLLVLLICVGFAGMAGRLPAKPDFQKNFSFDGTLDNAGSYANAIYYVIFAYGAYLSVLSLDEIRSSDLTVAANLFSRAFGGIFGTRVLPVFVGLSSFGFVGVVTYSSSRVILEFARQGHLPFDRVFSRVHPKLHTPIAALGLLYIITLIFLLAPPPGTAFQFIMSFSSYGDYFFAALCGIGLLLLRRREPNTKRPIRAPIPLVIFYLMICVFTLVFVYIPPTNAPAAYPYWGKTYPLLENSSTNIQLFNSTLYLFYCFWFYMHRFMGKIKLPLKAAFQMTDLTVFIFPFSTVYQDGTL
ncbi:amino acid permease-domain-containing protein [Chlamydoabsidia padenii]|nr:amino acid permease-domain-containing protein [Chlamydoabsidia padenii]